MPRRQRREQTSGSPIQRRVRTGCKTCRERKVKCDEGKPRCQNCTRRGLACNSGVQLKWEQEFVNRGLAFGRQGRWAKKDRRKSPSSPTPLTPPPSLELTEWCVLPPVRAHHFINTLYWEFDRAVEPKPGQDEDKQNSLDRLGIVPTAAGSPSIEFGSRCTSQSHPASSARSPLGLSNQMHLMHLTLSPTPSLSLPYSLSLNPALTSVDSALFEYYLKRLCPLTTPSRLCPSPFAYLIVPVLGVPGHEDILRALMALSARHRTTTDPDPAWRITAMTLRNDVISSLRRRLTHLASAPSGTWDAQILIMMMFLCLYEIVDNCDHRWVIHLRASQAIIRRSRQVQPTWETRGYQTHPHLGALTTFTEQFFAFQDVISRAACENLPLFGQEYWDEGRTNQQSSSSSSDIDSWMGCSTALVRVLCRITDLSRLKTRHAISAADFEGEAAALEQELDLLKPEETKEIGEIEEIDASGCALVSRNEGPADVFLAQSAELKRKAVVLYHCCVLYDASPSTPLVSELVTDILEGTAGLVTEGLTAGLSFPIFVAAVELDPLDSHLFQNRRTAVEPQVSGRRLVLEMLKNMAQSSLSNISRTKEVIEKVWRMRDMSLGGDEPCHFPEGANDWGVFVGPYSSNVSLA